MRYVVDIDGTICTPGPTDEMRYEQALPIQDRIDKINKLYDEGHTIVYLTARGMGRYKNNADLAKEEFYEFTEIQLSLWGCKYHQLFLGKPSGDCYIDDKGVHSDDFFRKLNLFLRDGDMRSGLSIPKSIVANYFSLKRARGVLFTITNLRMKRFTFSRVRFFYIMESLIILMKQKILS